MSLSPSDDSTVSAFLSTLSLEECSHLTADLGMVPIHNAFPIDSTHATLLQNYPLLSPCLDYLKHQLKQHQLSIEILTSLITSPKYSTFVWLNSHLVSFRNRSLSYKRVRTLLVFSVNEFSSGAKRKISSMYMITMQSLIISLKMLSIIAWNVVGELHIPKNITVGSKSPLFILKAFHWSPSLILTLLYPHQTSNLVNHHALLSLSRSSLINGKG